MSTQTGAINTRGLCQWETSHYNEAMTDYQYLCRAWKDLYNAKALHQRCTIKPLLSLSLNRAVLVGLSSAE